MGSLSTPAPSPRTGPNAKPANEGGLTSQRHDKCQESNEDNNADQHHYEEQSSHTAEMFSTGAEIPV